MVKSRGFLLDRAMRFGKRVAVLVAAAVTAACATPAPYDYTAFRDYRPASMLVLPPVNESPEVNATYGILSQVTRPLAESGFYVVPVSLMDETFRQNGLAHPAEIHDVSPKKLMEIFGADAAVYIKIKQYGTSYAVISSETRVTVEGKVVGLRTGQVLWEGSATASSKENEGSNQGGLVGLLVTAVVHQIIGTVTDESYKYAGIASERLLFARPNGLLHGPRSPQYNAD